MSDLGSEPAPPPAPALVARLLSNKLIRYGIAAIGPVGTAGAQFVLSFVLLHALSPAMFGAFSFLLVTSVLSMSVWSALFCAPMPLLLHKGDEAQIVATRRTLMATNLVLSLLAFVVFTAMGLLLKAPLAASLLFGAYVTAMLLRWFARAYAYAIGQQLRTTASDVIYSVALLAAVGGIVLLRSGSLELAYAGLLVSALLGLLPFGMGYLKRQFAEIAPRDLAGYPAVWKAHSGWSLVGVVTTEATVNAHAYIVTLVAGAAAFAPIAAAALLMRPISVATNALTEFERPQMAKQVAQGRLGAALKSANFFRAMLVAAWFGAVGLALLLYRFAPHVLFPPTYEARYLMIGTVLWMAVAVIRLARAPESVLLQAAGQFRPLAHASIISCGVSVVAVGLLLWLQGPLWSIVGIFIGECVFATWTWRQRRRWQAQVAAESSPTPEPSE